MIQTVYNTQVPVYYNSNVVADTIYNNFYHYILINNFFDDNSFKLFQESKFDLSFNAQVIKSLVNYALNDSLFGFYLLVNPIVWLNYMSFMPYINKIVYNIVTNNNTNDKFNKSLNNIMYNMYDYMNKSLSYNTTEYTDNINMETVLFKLQIVRNSKILDPDDEESSSSLIASVYEFVQDGIQVLEPLNDPFYDGTVLTFAGSITDKAIDLFYFHLDNVNNRYDLSNAIFKYVTTKIIFDEPVFLYDKFIADFINNDPFNYQGGSSLEFIQSIPEYNALSNNYIKMMSHFIEYFTLQVLTFILDLIPYSLSLNTNNKVEFQNKLLKIISLLKQSVGVTI